MSITALAYASTADLVAIQGLLMAARAATDDWRYPHVGEFMWNFFIASSHLDLPAHLRLWRDPAGQPVAYALLGEDPLLEWSVAPALAWGGLEEEILAWAEARLAEQRAGADAAAWSGPLLSGVRQDDAPRIAFLERHGFRRGEYTEVNMLCALDEPPPVAPLPAGWRLRAVDAATEIADRAAVERDIWGQWPAGQITTADYARLLTLPGYDPDLDVVAVGPEGLIGSYVNGWADPVNCIGDLGPVGTRVAYRRQGLSRAVLAECQRRLRARGMARCCVSTGVGNLAARGLYESLGFRVVNGWQEYKRAE